MLPSVLGEPWAHFNYFCSLYRITAFGAIISQHLPAAFAGSVVGTTDRIMPASERASFREVYQGILEIGAPVPAGGAVLDYIDEGVGDQIGYRTIEDWVGIKSLSVRRLDGDDECY